MCKFMLKLAVLALVVTLVSPAMAQNLVGNASWTTGNFTGWTGFTIAGGTAGAAMGYRTGALGTDAPVDVKCGGVDFGGNQSGWRAGMYQTVTGLTPEITYQLSAQGQITTIDIGGGAPSLGNDNLEMFWVDGTDTSFATTWPGSTANLATLVSNTGGWTSFSGTFTPTGSTIVIGFMAQFNDGGWIYASNSAVVDNVRLIVNGTNPWDVVYTGDAVPVAVPTGADPLYLVSDQGLASPTVQAGGGAEQPVGTPSYLNYMDNSATLQWDYLRTYTSIHMDKAGTLVLRMRRPVSAHGSGDLETFDIRTASHRIGLRFVDTGSGTWGVKVTDDAAQVGSTYAIGNYGDWHTIRLTWTLEAPNMRVRMYVDGDPTPVHNNAGDRTIAGTAFQVQTNGTNVGEGEFDIDWWLYTGLGAYDPTAGPAIPSGFTETPPASIKTWSEF